jgi:O-succinylbenzoic acid--CoA ligase
MKSLNAKAQRTNLSSLCLKKMQATLARLESLLCSSLRLYAFAFKLPPHFFCTDFSTSILLLNPRLDPAKSTHIVDMLAKHGIHEKFKSHIFLGSSGTTSDKNDDFKLIALSKKAILASALVVNQHLGATSTDIWLNCLPEFHVGGLGILARAYLSSSCVVTLKQWNPHEFVKSIEAFNVTLTSLVPTQVYDLVLNQLKAPKSLRAIVVGGGAMNDQLYKQALSLNWPLLPSYGLTECASQVATSKSHSTKLQFLNHIEANINESGFLMLKSEALLSATIFVTKSEVQVSDPKNNGWFTTEDLAQINGNALTIHGRSADFIKIGGEGVMFSHLEKRFDEIKLQCAYKHEAALVAYPDERLGFAIHLASTVKDTTELVAAFNISVMPYECIRKTHVVDVIPRTALNKICRAELLDKLIKA